MLFSIYSVEMGVVRELQETLDTQRWEIWMGEIKVRNNFCTNTGQADYLVKEKIILERYKCNVEDKEIYRES